MPRSWADLSERAHFFGGERREQFESFSALGGGFALVLSAIYALLAIPFGPYAQPLIVIAAIPIGIIGVAVNDSLVMIDFINERRHPGVPGRKAIIDGAKAWFRPIFVASTNTLPGADETLEIPILYDLF